MTAQSAAATNVTLVPRRAWLPLAARAASVLLAATAACRPSATPQKACVVEVFAGTPPPPTENLGPVSARCDASFSDEECVETLKEQVCRLGGDTVWGVGEPTLRDGKKQLSGRAARRK